ncbi:hypothetical protein GCM10027435_18660 [Haloparvum alkalitolerans]|uniref:DUF447 domain-containing protein n=1 Tax=Haloparvum alkalitolerans TaxID=1042953 RepID=UPI003CEC72F2
MTRDADSDADSDGADLADAGWPVDLRGVTESVVATRGPNDLWNHAALGLHAPEGGAGGKGGKGGADGGERAAARDRVTARTYGRTRTWRNFTDRGRGVVQFTSDPREFVDAALTIRETEAPVLPNADAWVEVAVERVDAREENGTTIREWALAPVESAVLDERVPTINRGFGAVIDATVAASRLDVPSFDEATLLDRLRYFAETVERCGGPREREAFARIDDATGWRDRLDGGD